MDALQPFQKDFYIPHSSVQHRSFEDIQAYRKTREVTVKVTNTEYL